MQIFVDRLLLQLFLSAFESDHVTVRLHSSVKRRSRFIFALFSLWERRPARAVYFTLLAIKNTCN